MRMGGEFFAFDVSLCKRFRFAAIVSFHRFVVDCVSKHSLTHSSLGDWMGGIMNVLLEMILKTLAQEECEGGMGAGPVCGAGEENEGCWSKGSS